MIPWMFCNKNISLLCYRDMRIYFRNIYGAVSRHFLNIAYIEIGLQQACGEGMAEHMRRYMKFNRCHGSIFVYHPAHSLIG